MIAVLVLPPLLAIGFYFFYQFGMILEPVVIIAIALIALYYAGRLGR